ncbi:MAG: amidophosphoribosyltransferase [Tissierellia bacterium]|nr:amidophosphoribosyltransferase [Tissierellia bacterium]
MSGIVGVTRESQYSAANLLLYGLYALQHRGQETAGIGVLEGNEFHIKKGTGIVSSVFREDVLSSLPGNRGVGHVKYGEYIEYDLRQPILPEEFKIRGQSCLIALDGNILNKDFSLYELAKALSGPLEGAKKYLSSLKGAFAGIYLDRYKMISFRDQVGLKPMCVGRLQDGYIFASETCAIDSCGATLVKMLDIGEMAIAKGGKVNFVNYSSNKDKKACLFEMIYVSRPDSYMDGVSIYQARHRMGQELYFENPTEADIVMGAPDSGLVAAIGYAEAAKIPYKDGIIKNRYVGRTFINSNDDSRTKDIFIKLNPIAEVLRGKRIILIDDSIVRGSTSKRTIKMLKDAGAKEVHVRISSPPVIETCNLSLDSPYKEKLIAHNLSIEELKDHIGADSLYFLSLEGLKKSCGDSGFCDNCFTGNYPIEVNDEVNI